MGIVLKHAIDYVIIKNILIIIKSKTGYIFGGYIKISYRVIPNFDYKIDNYCFLFSYNKIK